MARRFIPFLILCTIALSAAAAPPDDAAFIAKQVLNLSDEQLIALQQLEQARHDAIAPLQQQIAAHEENFRRAFRDILTPEQREKLDAIHGLQAALHAAEALRLLGL